jgi:hypothetical protein
MYSKILQTTATTHPATIYDAMKEIPMGTTKLAICNPPLVVMQQNQAFFKPQLFFS